ncbi:uncharacterized protein LY89DRAFT_145804 [Mollisia scopiformis]|uniref:Uncharacterized protein n=1 Tax=Mollisia scopiformis TaxID=149040 RepID=A0A194X0I7_MOLSC|nr:uncharacterized protein LY89DRAFT_145804 [Mollisia scopiformis]KUJ13705.1 hypothetical protein LY89DRAFT_145804 [Mollisia scopiformis]
MIGLCSSPALRRIFRPIAPVPSSMGEVACPVRLAVAHAWSDIPVRSPSRPDAKIPWTLDVSTAPRPGLPVMTPIF